MARWPLLCAASALCTSCLVVPEGARPGVGFDLVAASQYNFRGMVNNDTGVVQTQASVTLPTTFENGELNVNTWVNWDIHNDVGDAWFPDGHGGEPSEIDLRVSYSETYRGLDFTTGLENYSLQNADDFPFATERGETKEIFFVIGREIPYSMYTTFRGHYDFDEVDGWYFNGAIARDFPIDDEFTAGARLSLGYTDGKSSEWVNGDDLPGFSDLVARGELSYAYDPHTTLIASVNAVTIVDDDIADWFDIIGIESDNFWFSLGVSWGY